MKIDSRRLVLLLATAVSLIGYPNPASAATVTVAVGWLGDLVDFHPSSVTIHPGDQVKWIWLSSGHSTTSGRPGMPNGIWDSGVRSQGATFTHTFNSTGTFEYHCTQPPYETGKVIVTIPPPPVADFNSDGKPDYVLYNSSTQQTAIWYLNNNVHIASATGPTLPSGWQAVGVADFNRDDYPDYLLFNPSTHQTTIWYLSGVTHVSSASGPTLLSGWEIVATGDLNGDGKPDFVLYNSSTHQTAIWYMNNNVHVAGSYGPTLPAGYSLVAP